MRYLSGPRPSSLGSSLSRRSDVTRNNKAPKHTTLRDSFLKLK